MTPLGAIEEWNKPEGFDGRDSIITTIAVRIARFLPDRSGRVAEFLQGPLLHNAAARRQQPEHRHPAHQHHEDQSRGIHRMPHPAIRIRGDKGRRRARHGSRSDVPTEVAKHPREQRHARDPHRTPSHRTHAGTSTRAKSIQRGSIRNATLASPSDGPANIIATQNQRGSPRRDTSPPARSARSRLGIRCTQPRQKSPPARCRSRSRVQRP